MRARELNILCAGQLTSGRSTFLELYTNSDSVEGKYKIFAHRESNGCSHFPVFFHEIEEREGMEVYWKYPFDAVLFFVRIDAFHKTASNILDCILQYSQTNGGNVYKIPISIVVLSHLNNQKYYDIGYGDKQLLSAEVCSILEESQIIYVESDKSHEARLSQFYRTNMKGEGQGIKESAYSHWYFKGIGNYFSFGQLKLALFKFFGELKAQMNRKIKAIRPSKSNKHT